MMQRRSIAPMASRITPVLSGSRRPSMPRRWGGRARLRARRCVCLAQAGAADFGTVLPIPATTTDDPSLPGGASLLIGHPLRPLKPATDYVAVVMDSLRDVHGAAYPVPHAVRVALGIEPAGSAEEARLWGYHARRGRCWRGPASIRSTCCASRISRPARRRMRQAACCT